ncbi:UDP-N-acetylglucosamine 2-epimerase (non-hydrolyzing) [Marinomonas hwangdonensis]|uniref:UDP-N-acetylglucosamine 2-epimerase (Non-hydrolyzing) n=1 Tax=Marinomonas hwangdonensis TaxID=1053647 RepID=A0A3M8PY97_9GAMM|nr:UDP-N-acetylglucosamine 2-epimerase (non-hydrolyzing) [Marinomonas hwangdonensis]RNF48803.1 UDP-N-acetylglucosamine 2-epimerase (non-hydrolyzing) [Marinomonas hwangdonensis]
MNIVTILGARPQFIKAGPVSREIITLQQTNVNIEEVTVHTGQHYDANMSDIFFEEMKIPTPNYFLGIGGKSHGAMTGQMIEKIEDVLLKDKPDWVMVYGDTNSTLAGALAASKLQIKIAHDEAGLRSFNMRMPEDINKILTDRVCNVLLCPTQAAMNNLYNEAIENWNTKASALLVGDVMQDDALFYKELAQKPTHIHIDTEFVLCTIHRAENTDNAKRLADIVAALNEISKEKQVVLPLHPRTKKILQTGSFIIENLTITDPVAYLNMIWLLDNCSLVMTDIGGLHKEAYNFSVPCITMRDETEWVKLVEAGVNVLVGVDKIKIINAYQSIRNNFSDEIGKPDLYGKVLASQKAVEYIYL